MLWQPFSAIAPVEVDWLWPGRLPRGAITLLAGDPGLGKSFLTLDIAARVSRGWGWPDDPIDDDGDTPPERAPGGVLLLSAEDHLGGTVRPRLDAAGADVRRVRAASLFQTADGTHVPLNLRDHLENLDNLIETLDDVHLLVIDPIASYLGWTDDHKNGQVRGLLAPLAALAERRHLAVLLVSHLNKGAGGKAVYRSMGSLAFMAAARAGWLVAKDPDDPDRRLLLPVKNNLAADLGGLAFRLSDGRVSWDPDPITTSADEVLARESFASSGGGSSSLSTRGANRDACAVWLRTLLEPGPQRREEVARLARQAGYSNRTLERVRAELPIRVHRRGYGAGSHYTWSLDDASNSNSTSTSTSAAPSAPTTPRWF